MLKTYSLLLLFTFLKINPAKAVNLSTRIGFKQQPERGYFTVMKLIPLSKTGYKHAGKYFAMVDDEDYEYLCKLKWAAVEAKNTVYAISLINKKPVKMSNFIIKPDIDTYTIDHIDKNGLNNQKSNLRKATRSQNSCNRTPKKNAHSKYIGVYKARVGWTSSVRKGRKDHYLGVFKTEIEAAKAYDIAAKKIHGEFASQNFTETEQEAIDNDLKINNDTKTI